jgi:hypothetical protein
MPGIFATITEGLRRRQRGAGPDPEQMQLVTAQLAQTVAIELVLKMLATIYLTEPRFRD